MVCGGRPGDRTGRRCRARARSPNARPRCVTARCARGGGGCRAWACPPQAQGRPVPRRRPYAGAASRVRGQRQLLQSQARKSRWSRQPHGVPQRHLRAAASSTARTPRALAQETSRRQPVFESPSWAESGGASRSDQLRLVVLPCVERQARRLNPGSSTPPRSASPAAATRRCGTRCGGRAGRRRRR